MSECYSLDVVDGSRITKLVIIKRGHDSRWYLSLRQAYNACAALGDKSSWGAFYRRIKTATRAVVEEASKQEIRMLVMHGALSPHAPSASLVSVATLLVAQRDAYALPTALGTALAGLVQGTLHPTPLGTQQVGQRLFAHHHIAHHHIAHHLAQHLIPSIFKNLLLAPPAGTTGGCRCPGHSTPRACHPPTNPFPSCSSITEDAHTCSSPTSAASPGCDSAAPRVSSCTARARFCPHAEVAPASFPCSGKAFPAKTLGAQAHGVQGGHHVQASGRWCSGGR